MWNEKSSLETCRIRHLPVFRIPIQGTFRLDSDKPRIFIGEPGGVRKEERELPTSSWCFISTDLPSFSSATETSFVFHPKEQKGMQCRFGERGVTAATHFDAGRNMIAMVTGAKPYILVPPTNVPNWEFSTFGTQFWACIPYGTQQQHDAKGRT
jgi:hypothetical protein